MEGAWSARQVVGGAVAGQVCVGPGVCSIGVGLRGTPVVHEYVCIRFADEARTRARGSCNRTNNIPSIVGSKKEFVQFVFITELVVGFVILAETKIQYMVTQ